jgi:hypothetical protein
LDDVVAGHALSNGFRTVSFAGDLVHRRFAILTNLNLPAVDYYWAVQAVDTALAGGPWSSSVLSGPPGVVTLPATGVTSNSATLNATVNPANHATEAWFEYGLTTSYGTATPLTNLPTAGSNMVVGAELTGLVLGTTYHYRIVASNASGLVTGDDLTFVPSLAPTALTLYATNYMTNFNATVTASANPGGIPTTIYFEWGTTIGYGNTTGPMNIGNGTNTLPVNAVLSGLSLGSIYHYRVVASNAVGVTYGPDLTFGVNLIPGDLNFDGFVDLDELNLIIQYYRRLLP